MEKSESLPFVSKGDDLSNELPNGIIYAAKAQGASGVDVFDQQACAKF